MSGARATRVPEGDAEVMAEVGSVPIGRWLSPWVDGRRPIGADEAPIADAVYSLLPARDVSFGMHV